MNFTPFELLAWQEQHGATDLPNLADSGCRPVKLGDLAGSGVELEELLSLELQYPPVRGTGRLRTRIADWHAGSEDRAGNVIVTVGAAEANALAVETLLEPGDHVVTLTPGYRQVWGAARNRGAVVEEVPYDPQRGWRPDLDALERTVRPGTKVISLVNPNNPTGTVLDEEEMDALVRIAERCGAWILSDEVHRGTELHLDRTTPSFWGRYERVLCVGSLSKALGMSGLRLGWLIAPEALVPRLCRRHEYATVSTSSLSMALAERALTAERREHLLGRYRGFLRESWATMSEWGSAHDGLLSVVPPQATSLALVRYDLDLPSTEVAEALYTRGGVSVGAGAHFGAEGHLRITYGHEPAQLSVALDRVSRVMKELQA